ncbi:putative tyrosine-protein phosphatase auxilin [Triplophysa rosa]|uniref:Tyrosine-protein phosphatase auxilin n=1 Tax=Triplophysa rosa TaxID=992332 RepID=A0A9W7THI7_TRIRA|nr:putative tyrosine-protein phosphatase auxilin [Triplophysa rosa]
MPTHQAKPNTLDTFADLGSLGSSLGGGSGFSSKPATPSGTGGAFPPMCSPQRPDPSPQHTASGGWHPGTGFPSWQPGGTEQNRPNYNVSFSNMVEHHPGALERKHSRTWEPGQRFRMLISMICSLVRALLGARGKKSQKPQQRREKKRRDGKRDGPRET